LSLTIGLGGELPRVSLWHAACDVEENHQSNAEV